MRKVVDCIDIRHPSILCRQSESCLIIPIANIKPSAPTLSPRNLNPENWLRKVIQMLISQIFSRNCDSLPTVFCITKMEVECVWWWIILVSVIPAYCAYSLTLPTVPTLSPISSEYESCLIIHIANIIPSPPSLSPMILNLENWLRKVIQIHISLVFIPNCDPLPTVFCISKMKVDCGR